MTTQEYMYWDGTAKTYVPVKSDTAQSQTDNSKSPTVEKPEKDEKKSKAKSIAKVLLIMGWAVTKLILGISGLTRVLALYGHW